MSLRSSRSVLSALVAVAALAVLASACSSDTASTERSAAGASGVDTSGYSFPQGDPAVAVNADNWCLRPQNVDGDEGFRLVRNIVACNVMNNAARRFTAPGVLDGKFPLGVTKALCSQNDYTCRDTGGYYGEVRTEGVNASNVNQKGDRYTYPNPFLVSGAIQFMPKKIWQGVETKTYVGSNVAPFNLTSQVLAQLHVDIPTTGDNSADCTQGQYITCALDSSVTRDSQQRFVWTLGTLPLQIQINNSSGRTMVQQSSPIAGPGFLIDPNGTSTDAQLASIPAGGTVFIGGYRSANSDVEQSWTANYVIKSLSGDVPVTITIKLAKVDNKWVSQSKCTVSNRSATTTFKCNEPTINDSDAYRQAVVNITDY
jgi:hypothetical protein